MLSIDQAKIIEKNIVENYSKSFTEDSPFISLCKTIFQISARASIMALLEYEKLIHNK